MIRRFWNKLLRKVFAGQEVTRSKRRSARPLLEQLEDLTLPSGIEIFPTYVMSNTHQVSHGQAHPAAGAINPFTNSLTPAQVRNAYGINGISFQVNGSNIAGTGKDQTIAIVDAYDDPTIASDLAYFDSYYGLAAPPTFTKVGINSSGQPSTSRFPSADQGWAGEITLDVEWAHAVAPQANILLVEANSNSFNDLLNAVNYARNYAGVTAVSLSWGSGEFSGQTGYDSYFTTPSGHPGVTYFGSSGDSGAPAIWPALSSHVVAVGGTSLNLSGNSYSSESGWSGSGGSLSQFVSQPSWQNGLVIANGLLTISAGGMRAGPDISAVADPNTGLAVYGAYAFNSSGYGGWMQIGGTSASAPQWAGLMAIVNQGRVLNGLGAMDGYTQTLPALYKLPSGDFHDVTSGSNGYSAGTGFDLVTGRGSPIANLLVPALAGVSGGGSTKPPTITTGAQAVASNNNMATLSVAATDSAGNSLTYTWTATGPAAVGISPNGTGAASTSTATFSAAGVYSFQVTVTDTVTGLTATSQTPFTVSAVPTSLALSPSNPTIAVNGQQQFTATVLDQFAHAVAPQPAMAWNVTSGTGTITTGGLYTAPATGEVDTVQASGGGFTSTTMVTVSTGPTITTAAYIVGQSSTTVTAPTIGLAVVANDPAGSQNLTYTWTANGPAVVGISPNNSNAASQTTVTFSAAGTYNFLVTVKDPSNLTATSSITVMVNAVVTSISVSPSSVTLAPNATQQFTATAKDQFGNPIAAALTWSATPGTTGAGTFSSTAAGLYTAPATSGTNTVTASSGSVQGQATVTVSSATVLFSDNFAAGAGKWSVHSGYYYLDTLSTGEKRVEVDNYGGVSRIVAGSSSWSNYSYQATLTVLSSNGGSVSLLARVQDDSHLYFFGYNAGLGAWFIAKKNGNTTTTLAVGAPYTAYYNQDYVVRANLYGSSLSLDVNGVRQVSTTDKTFTKGKIGFSSTWAVGMLGNVTVTALTGPATSAFVAGPASSSQTVAWPPPAASSFPFTSMVATASSSASQQYYQLFDLYAGCNQAFDSTLMYGFGYGW